MPIWPLQTFESLCPEGDHIIRHSNAYLVELAVLSEVRFNEVSTCGRSDDLCVATSEKLRNSIDMIVMTMRADYVVLSLSTRVQRLIVVVLDWAVLKIRSKMGVAVCPMLASVILVPNLFAQSTILVNVQLAYLRSTGSTGSICNA